MLEITWFGNASLKMFYEGTTLFFDPFFSRNPDLAMLGLDDIAPAAALLLTHGHFDHAADIPAIVRRTQQTVHAPAEVEAQLRFRRGVCPSRLRRAVPHQPIQIGGLRCTPLAARHVHIDFPLVLKTAVGILGPRGRGRRGRLPALFLENIRCPEGACIAWVVEGGGKTVLHLGSLGLDEDETYPTEPDLLSIPLQGNSRIEEIALEIVSRIAPKAVLLHHIDDAFPPLSQNISTDYMIWGMRERFPTIPVIVPAYRVPQVV